MLHSIVETVTIWPWWAVALLVIFIGTSPLVVKRWRRVGGSWHKSQ